MKIITLKRLYLINDFLDMQTFQNRFAFSIFIVIFLDLFFLFFGYWEFAFLAAFCGCVLLYDKPRFGTVSGSSGIILSWILFLNLKLLFSLKVWDLFMETILEIGGLGWLGILILLGFLGIIGALSGYCGASCAATLYPTLLNRLEIKKTHKLKLKSNDSGEE